MISYRDRFGNSTRSHFINGSFPSERILRSLPIDWQLYSDKRNGGLIIKFLIGLALLLLWWEVK